MQMRVAITCRPHLKQLLNDRVKFREPHGVGVEKSRVCVSDILLRQIILVLLIVLLKGKSF